jgi:hypothetical protein
LLDGDTTIEVVVVFPVLHVKLLTAFVVRVREFPAHMLGFTLLEPELVILMLHKRSMITNPFPDVVLIEFV